ncbi:MAG: ABC transporter permease [Cuniculiplasma sp.]
MSLLKDTYIYYFKNYYRSRSFYLMFLISILVSILLIYLSFRYQSRLANFASRAGVKLIGPNSTEKILAYLWALILSTLPVFASVFFGSPAISSEIESKTAFHIFTLPIPRSVLLIGKYLAAVTATTLIVISFTIIEMIVFQYIYGYLIIQFLYSFLLTLVFVFAISGVTFLISSIFNKNTYAYISVLLIYLLIFNAGTIVIELLYKTTPYYLLNEAETAVYRVFLNFSFGITTAVPSSISMSTHEMIANALIMGLYAIISFGITLILFERKEVK